MAYSRLRVVDGLADALAHLDVAQELPRYRALYAANKQSNQLSSRYAPIRSKSSRNTSPC